MMIKCAKCGFENQMGAIFCRQCGEKINMDEISPESIEQGKKKDKAKQAAAKAIRWTVRILVLLVILGVAAAAFAPWDLPVYVAPNENSADFKAKEESAMLKLKFFSEERLYRLPEKESISIDELNILFCKYFLKPGENKSFAWTLDHIYFIPEKDSIKTQVFARLFDTIPVVFQFKGMAGIKSGDSNDISLRIDSAVIGHLPLIFCEKPVAGKLEEFLNNDELKRVFKRTESITLDKDQLVFRFRPQEKVTEAAAAPAVEKPAEVQKKSMPSSKKSKKSSGKKKSSKN